MPLGTTSLATNYSTQLNRQQSRHDHSGERTQDQRQIHSLDVLPRFYLRLRGTLLFALALFWAVAPARTEADIVAAVISYTFLTFLFLATAWTLRRGFSMKRHSTVSLQTVSPSGTCEGNDGISLTPLRLLIRAVLPRLTPSFQYELSIDFAKTLKPKETHILRGQLTIPTTIEQEIIFPHRGVWKTSKLNILHGDRFSLAAFTHPLSPPQFQYNFRIEPRRLPLQNFVVASASQTSGDEIAAQQERKGDYLDLKPYHPSDGTRRILWKVFAKSGELLTRHPEQTYTPEGEALFFVSASRYDDTLCGKMLTYLDSLQEQGLHFQLRCEGQVKVDKSVTTVAEANDLFIDTAWNTDHYDLEKSCEELQPLLSKSPDTIYICVSFERLLLVKYRTLITRIGNFLVKNSTKPSFFIFFDQAPANVSREERRVLGDFEKECATRSWECNVVH